MKFKQKLCCNGKKYEVIPSPSAGKKSKESIQYQSSWSKTQMELEAKTGRSGNKNKTKKTAKNHSSHSTVGHQAISHRYSALPEPNQSITETSSDEEEQAHIPRKSQFPVRMSLQTTSKDNKNTTEIITSNISLQEALAKKSKKKQSVFGNVMRKTKVLLQEAVTGEPVFTDSDWDEEIVREQEIEKMKKKANKKFRQSIIRKSQADPDLMKDAGALIKAYEDAPLRLTTEDQMKLEEKVEQRLQLLREEREIEQEEEQAEKAYRESQKKPNRLTVAFKALTGGADAIIREEEKRHDFEEQAVKRLTRFSAGAKYQAAPDYHYDRDPERQKNDDVSDDEEEESSEESEEQTYNENHPEQRFQTIKETSHQHQKNYDGYEYTNHENSTTTQKNTFAHDEVDFQDSNVRFSEKYNDEKIRKQFRKSTFICPSNRKGTNNDFNQQDFDDLTSNSSDSSSESNTEQPTQNTTTCASNRSKKSYKSNRSSNKSKSIKSQRSERSVENTINSHELSHLRLDKDFGTNNRCANIETQTSCMILVTKDQVLESIRKNNVTPIPPKCISAATQTTTFVNTSNQQILSQLRYQIETGCFESPKQFYSSSKYRGKKYNKRKYKNRSINKNNNGHFSDETLDNLASLQQDLDSQKSSNSNGGGYLSSFHADFDESSDFPEISEIEIDIAEQMELQARISLTDPVQYLVDEYNQRLQSRQEAEIQASDTFLPESTNNPLKNLNRRESGNTVAMIQESIASPTGISECQENQETNNKTKNVSISLPVGQSNYDRFVSNTGLQGYDSLSTPNGPNSFKYRSEDPFSTYGNVTKLSQNNQNRLCPENRMSVESTKGSVGVQNLNFGVNESFLNAGEMDHRNNGRVSDFTEKSEVTESVGLNAI